LNLFDCIAEVETELFTVRCIATDWELQESDMMTAATEINGNETLFQNGSSTRMVHIRIAI
jgi:hypothetical protein